MKQPQGLMPGATFAASRAIGRKSASSGKPFGAIAVGGKSAYQHNMRRTTLAILDVRTRPGNRRQGWLAAGPRRIPVALGRAGIKANKREGDGATPTGRFHLVRLWWRADRLPRPRTRLPIRPIGPLDGWCEDPADRRYNRPIKLEPDRPGDRLRRADALYDMIIEIDHNTRPRIAGRGSAVFLHVARAALAPTAGCIAMPAATLRRLLVRLGPNTSIRIHC
jgi:L,D-peptidoglycan transpeptidase YkuD (ErfK/YbiS/YcfS/YnhG family)